MGSNLGSAYTTEGRYFVPYLPLQVHTSIIVRYLVEHRRCRQGMCLDAPGTWLVPLHLTPQRPISGGLASLIVAVSCWKPTEQGTVNPQPV